MRKKKPKKELFLELAKPDETGLSRKVFPHEFTGEYESLSYKNGNPWKRSVENLKFDVYIHKEKGKTKYIQTRGFKKRSFSQNINSKIFKAIKRKRCCVLDTSSQIECDHKRGDKYCDIEPKYQNINDFQPMNRIVNQAKREHCKKCQKTKQRFNARNLGYKKSVFKGRLRFEGTCEGCYWHDPYAFNQNI